MVVKTIDLNNEWIIFHSIRHIPFSYTVFCCSPDILSGLFYCTKNLFIMKRNFSLLVSLIILSTTVNAQLIVSGKLIDRSNSKAVSFVHITQNDSKTGTVSDESGVFSIGVNNIKGFLRFQAIGYKTNIILYKVKDQKEDLGNIYLSPESYTLDEITITAGLAMKKGSPVTVSTIDSRNFRSRLGDQPVSLAMLSVPGVYSVRNGGGSGDAELSIRGFQQENVTILLNGIPYNGVENGLVYWSNWLGLNDAIAEIQIQKGPGMANVAINAVGGSVNIVSEPANKEKGGSIGYQITDYGNRKLFLILNSGKMDNNWSVSFMGSYINGKGYIDATYVNGLSYFLALNKQINANNKVTVSFLGSPNHHGQRTLKLSGEEHKYYGNLHNKDWGGYNGQMKNASENFYHKPFLGINHYLTIDNNRKLANSIYVSYGTGGGRWSESFNYAPSIFEYRNSSEQIDWLSIYENNLTHENQYTLANGDIVSDYSMNVLTHFLASHIQTGVLSTFEQNLNDRLKLITGVHYRYFNSFLRERITDLFGGDYFIEDYGWAVDGVAGREQIKTTGDLIKINNNSVTHFVNAYAQLLFDSEKLNAYFSLNGNNNWYQRIDRYNYVSNTKSEVLIKPGFDTRAGISYQPENGHVIYLNGAYLSRAPYYKFAFGNYTNVHVQNLKNELIETIEIGYRFENPFIEAKINSYYTNRGNASLLSNEYVQLEDNTQTRAMVNGLNAIHKGIENEVKAKIGRNISLGGFFSLGDFKWQNDVSAQLFNNSNVVVDTVNVFAKGLYVGGTAQQQFGLLADFKIVKFFNIGAEWMYYNKLFANFNPGSRTDPYDRSQAYRIPSYNNLNLHINIMFKIFDRQASLQLNGFNLLNDIHILNGEDGINHDLNSFRGFWSFGRTFDFTVKANF